VEIRFGAILGGRLGLTQCSPNVARSQARRRERTLCPEDHARTSGEAGPFQALLGCGARLGEAAELDQRRHRLNDEDERDSLTPRLRGNRRAAREIGKGRVELAERTARSSMHPERR
jgi:hypothetical protein